MKRILKYGVAIITGFSIGCVYCCMVYKCMKTKDLENTINEMTRLSEPGCDSIIEE